MRSVRDMLSRNIECSDLVGEEVHPLLDADMIEVKKIWEKERTALRVVELSACIKYGLINGDPQTWLEEHLTIKHDW